MSLNNYKVNTRTVIPCLYYPDTNILVDPGGPAVNILASGSEVRGFDPGRGRWIFSERKNSEYDFFGREVKQ